MSLMGEMLSKICVRDQDAILDVGCGDGTMLAELTRWRDADGYGIDIDPELIATAASAHPDLHFKVGSSDFLDFDDHMFRIITVCSSFHLFPDQEAFIKEAARVLTAGGRLYIGEPSRPDLLRITGNTVFKIIPGIQSFYPSTYDILSMFKEANLTKFRLHKRKGLVLYSAKKPLPQEKTE